MTDQDQDLERELRSQRGPREVGYTPSPLPTTPDSNPAPGGGRSRVLRTGLLVGAAAAAALTVAVVAGILPRFGTGVGGTSSPTPSVASPGIGACVAADLDLVAEPWGGAAGGRGTIATVSLGAGRSECLVMGPVTAEIADANGALLISGTSTATDGSIELQRGSSLALSVVWSNWCGTDPLAPVALSLKADGWQSPVPVMPGGDDPVPPCNGAGEPSSVSVTRWEQPYLN